MSTAVDQAKVSLVNSWDSLGVEERREFLRRIAPGPPYDFIRWTLRFPSLHNSDPYLERVARDWPYVIETLRDTDLQFAKGFMKCVRERKAPSGKQAAYAKSLHRDWLKYREVDADEEVTESE